MTSQLLAAAAAVGLLGAGFAGTAETRSFAAMTGPSSVFGNSEGGAAGMCRVEVIRTGRAGSADVFRQDLADGSCVCTITTGPADNNGSAEATVTALLRDRKCDGPPIQGEQADGGVNVGTVAGIVAGIGGLVVGLSGGGGGNNDSAG